MNNELKKLQSEIAELTSASLGLQERIRKARQVASDARGPSERLASLRESRRQHLADAHLGFGDKSALADVNKALARAETEQREADAIAEGAAAAAERLVAEDEAIQRRLAELNQLLPDAMYQAHCAHAADAVSDFHQALERLAKSHAVLQGRLLAADRFADPRRGRVFVASGLASSFASTLPGIPGHRESEEVVFNMRPDIECELQAAFGLIGGEGVAPTTARNFTVDFTGTP